jgi:hypothetical protein
MQYNYTMPSNPSEYSKKYYEENKAKLREKAIQYDLCPLQCTVKHGNLAKHKQTKKHLKLIQPLTL